MKTRKEHLDPVEDKLITLIPDDFPDYKQFQGIEYYDYYKVNRWFEKHPELRASRGGYCIGCLHFMPSLLEELCQNSHEMFDPETCYQSSKGIAREDQDA